MELIFQVLFAAGAATSVTSVLLIETAFVASRRTFAEGLARAARWGACFVMALAVAGSVGLRITTVNWVHFQWSLGYPLLGAFCVSGAFLPWMWPSEHSGTVAAAPAADAWTRSGWWFPAVALAIGTSSVWLQLLLPGEVPAVRNSPGPLVGTIELAAYGLGLGDLPAVLHVRFPHDAARGMDHLSRDLTVPLSVLTLTAEMLCAYVALALGLRFVPHAAVRFALRLVAPIGVTGFMFSRWRRLASGLWHETPAEIRAFGPTLLAATIALAVLVVLWLRDRAHARSARRDFERAQ